MECVESRRRPGIAAEPAGVKGESSSRKTSTRKTPEIDLAACVCCQGCEELCPEVFHLGPAGYMEVEILDEYPEDRIDEAVCKCPKDCIRWSEEA